MRTLKAASHRSQKYQRSKVNGHELDGLRLVENLVPNARQFVIVDYSSENFTRGSSYRPLSKISRSYLIDLKITSFGKVAGVTSIRLNTEKEKAFITVHRNRARSSKCRKMYLVD